MSYRHQAETLKDLRTRANRSILEVARLMGLKSYQFVSNIERGMCGIHKRRVPQLAAILADGLKVDAALVEWELWAAKSRDVMPPEPPPTGPF